MGTASSPGNIVATVVGDVITSSVGEVELGTSLRGVISRVGVGVTKGRTAKAVLSGVANAVVTSENLDVPVRYEGLRGDRQWDGLGRVHRVRRHHVHGRCGVPILPLPLRRVVRPIARRASSARAQPPNTSSASRQGEASNLTSMPSSGGRTTSPTAVAATSRSRNK